MPVSKYNPQFGGKPGSAQKAKSAMAETYGEKKGEQVFYATKNKRKSQGMKLGGVVPGGSPVENYKRKASVRTKKPPQRGNRMLPGQQAQAMPSPRGGFNVQPGFMKGGKAC